MGNQDPESGVVRSEVKHVWEGVSILPLSFSPSEHFTHIYNLQYVDMQKEDFKNS